MKKIFTILLIELVIMACREELTSLKAPVDPPLGANCQAPSIEKNILGTWQFETVGPTPNSPIRRGRVTFDEQNHVIDPDSLYDNYINIGSSRAKVILKIYDTDGDYQPISYPGRLFRIVLATKDGTAESRPSYVETNACRKIVIYETRTYRLPNKTGFILTR
jgi:hypothetical protein